jgi:hypothetical protein
VRDAISLTKAGHPTVVIVQDSFERAARAQAAALGLPESKIYVHAQHKAGHLGAEETAKGVQAAAELRLMLENRNG